jgi:DNA recombination protein RmuC
MIAEKAQEIADLGRDLYDRIRTLADHFANLGKGLDKAVESYNKAVGSLESRVLVSARQFTKLGAASKEEIPALEPIEKSSRSLQASELVEGGLLTTKPEEGK